MGKRSKPLFKVWRDQSENIMSKQSAYQQVGKTIFYEQKNVVFCLD